MPARVLPEKLMVKYCELDSLESTSRLTKMNNCLSLFGILKEMEGSSRLTCSACSFFLSFFDVIIVPLTRRNFPVWSEFSVFIQNIRFNNIKNLLRIYITAYATFAFVIVSMLYLRLKIQNRVNGVTIID
jgi:hypothetical protein